jgi:hypothetical protein
VQGVGCSVYGVVFQVLRLGCSCEVWHSGELRYDVGLDVSELRFDSVKKTLPAAAVVLVAAAVDAQGHLFRKRETLPEAEAPLSSL